MTLRRLLALVPLLVALCAFPGAAQASDGQASIMLDDDQLLYRGDAVRDAALKRMKDLGVDYARVSVLWSVAAENARKGRARRRRFKGEDPRTYPPGNWDRYDRLVRAAQRIGIGVYFNVTGPGPSFARGRPPAALDRNRTTWMPRIREFGKFVRALGTRYSGSYADENDNGAVLPRVTFWSVYNEPNQGGWLTPQYLRRGSRVIPWSPVIYRDLWAQARTALDQTGHGDDTVLIGETAPLGSGRSGLRSPIRPRKFIRELFCIRSDGTPYSGSAARVRKCSALQRIGGLRATAWAHHPYTKNVSPTRRDRSPDALTMANIGELAPLLDQVSAAAGLAQQPWNVMLTEFGFETDPPDRFSGVSLERQAEWTNIGEWQAYADPRILGQTQFLLRDVAPLRGISRRSKRAWFTYQSGLFFRNGRPKPAAAAYVMPIHRTGTAPDGSETFWGMLRFVPNGVPSEVRLEFRAQGTDAFTQQGEPIPVTNGHNFWEAARPAPGPGSWRAVFVNPVTGQASLTSREVDVG